MKILLIGKYGQVGWELNRTLLPLGKIVAVDYPEIDLSKEETIEKWVNDVQPDVVINAAAYTDVEKAEQETGTAFSVNGRAPGVLAESAKSIGAVFIHYSTDYVFDGQKDQPYLESDMPNPINEYGKSKLAGEKAVQEVNGAYLILRTSWVYSLRRSCFVTKALSWAQNNKELKIVDDQIGSPTWCRTLAEITAQIVGKGCENLNDWIEERKGIYHVAGKGFTNRYDFVKCLINNISDKEKYRVEDVHRAKSSEFDTLAERPPFSALDCQKVENTFDIKITPWEVQIPLALNDEGSV